MIKFYYGISLQLKPGEKIAIVGYNGTEPCEEYAEGRGDTDTCSYNSGFGERLDTLSEGLYTAITT